MIDQFYTHEYLHVARMYFDFIIIITTETK